MRPKASGVGKLDRYFVPDLSPIDRDALAGERPGVVFVAESPHVNEIEPEKLADRRPLCGAAGKAWWSLVSEFLDGSANADVGRDHLLELCRKHGIAVLNAVQYPMDPKITAKFPDADPVANLTFAKGAGPSGYKRRKASAELRAAVADLRRRLTHPSLARAAVWPLGNDAEWFVAQALTPAELSARVAGKIPHPSAWWRSGGLFGRTAREKLGSLWGKATSRRKTA